MKLIIAIVRDIDETAVIDQLIAHSYRVTRMSSTGGFLRRGMVTLLIGTDESRVDAVIEIIRSTCRQPEGSEHRATIFIVNATHFEQL
jgi:uncharacterized protein YaaQ